MPATMAAQRQSKLSRTKALDLAIDSHTSVQACKSERFPCRVLGRSLPLLTSGLLSTVLGGFSEVCPCESGRRQRVKRRMKRSRLAVALVDATRSAAAAPAHSCSHVSQANLGGHRSSSHVRAENRTWEDEMINPVGCPKNWLLRFLS
jgi:hypothetical protein